MTKMYFQIKELGSSKIVANSDLTVNTTISDHDCRLFKFPEQKVVDGKFDIKYIFPDDGQHRVILQLYRNDDAFTVASFNLNIPHPQYQKVFLNNYFNHDLIRENI